MSGYFPSCSLHLVHACWIRLLQVVSSKAFVFIFYRPRSRCSRPAFSWIRRHTARWTVNAEITVSTLISDQWVLMWPIFDQGVPLHEKRNVYIRLWEGLYPTHRLNLSRWPISLFAEVHIPIAVGICQDAVTIAHMIIVGGNEISKYVSLHCKNILRLVYCMRQTAHIYSLFRRLGNILSFPARKATTWVWLLLLSLWWAWPHHVRLLPQLCTRCILLSGQNQCGDFF